MESPTAQRWPAQDVVVGTEPPPPVVQAAASIDTSITVSVLISVDSKDLVEAPCSEHAGDEHRPPANGQDDEEPDVAHGALPGCLTVWGHVHVHPGPVEDHEAIQGHHRHAHGAA